MKTHLVMVPYGVDSVQHVCRPNGEDPVKGRVEVRTVYPKVGAEIRCAECGARWVRAQRPKGSKR